MRRAPAYPSVMRVTSLKQSKGNSVEPQSRNVFKQCAGNRSVQGKLGSCAPLTRAEAEDVG